MDSVRPGSQILSMRRSGWVLYAALGLLFGVYLGINQIVDLRGHVEVAAWKPLVWEISSVIVIFALAPFVARFEQRFRLDAQPRWRVFVPHAAAAVIFSALHIAGMLALREIAYGIAGQHYDYGNLPVRAFYELQKDLITYIVILGVIFASRE